MESVKNTIKVLKDLKKSQYLIVLFVKVILPTLVVGENIALNLATVRLGLKDTHHIQKKE